MPLYPPLTEPNFGGNVDNYQQRVPLRSKNNALDHHRGGFVKPTTSTEASVATPTVKKKRRKPQRAQSTQEPSFNYQQPQVQQQQQQQQRTSSVTNDRIPRPFALPTDANPTPYVPVYPTKFAAAKQNTVRPTSAEQIYHFPTNPVRQNLARPTVPLDTTIGQTTVPLRQNVRTTVPTRQEQIHSTVPVKQEQNISYSTFPVREEPTAAYQRTPLRRNSLRHSASVEEAEALANLPGTRKTIPVKEEEPVVYKIPRRLEQTNVRSNIPLRQDQEFVRPNTLQEQGNVRATVPARREQSLVRSTVPIREEQQSLPYGTVPARSDQVLANPTVPARRTYATIPRQEQTYPTATARQEQPLTYSTVPARQEQAFSYQPNPPRRNNNLRQSIPTQETEIPSTVPALQNRIVVQSSSSPRQKSYRQNLQYEDDVIPPTVPIEQGYPTVAKPTYVPRYPDSRANRGPAQFKSNNQEDAEEDSNDNYKDNVKKNNNDNDDNDDDDDDHHGYSYSHIERIEEPADGGKPIKTIIHNNRAYQVNEDEADQPQFGTQPIKTYPVLQRGALKRVENDFDQNRVQYPDEPDYDQARGQNVQLEVAEHPHRLRGDTEDLVEEANHHHKKHHKPKKHSEHHEESGAAEHHEGDHEEHGEKGEKV